MFEHPADTPLDDIKNDIDHIFELFDYIEWLQLVSGEVFMHRDTDKILRHALLYKDKFDKLIIITNATIVPSQAELDALQLYGEACSIQISDYGKLSAKKAKLTEALEKNNIPFVVKCYHGDEQYFGGWIDNTRFEVFQGSDDELAQMTRACPQVIMQNMHCLNGKLHRCSNSCFLNALGKVTAPLSDYVDLNNDGNSLDDKRKILSSFYSRPRASCRVCGWYKINNENIERFPAAEQI
jgi:hypothetical protein